MDFEYVTTETLVLDFKNFTAVPNVPHNYDQEVIDVSPALLKNLGDVVFVVEVTFDDGNTFGITSGHKEYFACETMRFAQALASNIREDEEDVVTLMLRHSGNEFHASCFGYFASNRETKILAFQVVQ